MARHLRLISICLLLWLVPFFAVIAPGHQRGVLKTPGSGGETSAVMAPKCPLCVFVAGLGNSDQNEPLGGPITPTDPAGDCAICYLNGTLLTPPPFELPNLRPERIDLPLALALVSQPAPTVTLDHISPRGPPA